MNANKNRGTRVVGHEDDIAELRKNQRVDIAALHKKLDNHVSNGNRQMIDIVDRLSRIEANTQTNSGDIEAIATKRSILTSVFVSVFVSVIAGFILKAMLIS